MFRRNIETTYDEKDVLLIDDTIQKSKTTYCLKYQRTEYAKLIRSEYDRGLISERRCNMREYTVRNDSCCNTISTVTKDNYLLEVNKYGND